MWETMKNSEVCAFFEDELLTVVDKVGKGSLFQSQSGSAQSRR